MSARECPTCGWPLVEEWFDDARQEIVVRGERRRVPNLQWQLLSILRRYRGHLIPIERLYDMLYNGHEDPPPTNNLRVYAFRLRKLLRGTPFAIIARSRSGYMLDRRTRA